MKYTLLLFIHYYILKYTLLSYSALEYGEMRCSWIVYIKQVIAGISKTSIRLFFELS